MTFDSAAAYTDYLSREAGVPRGFRFFSGSLDFVPVERPSRGSAGMNLALLVSDAEDTRAAVVTTSNRYVGAPVTLARERADGGRIRAVLVNNKIANVGTPNGLQHARDLAQRTAELVSCPPEQALSLSTGIIGWELPHDLMSSVLADVVETPVQPYRFAESIMTTDRYPKMAWTDDGTVRCLGIAKGAGMVEPNLATMLGFILTDAVVEHEVLKSVLRRVSTDTFNALSVDGDQSTSDAVVLLANGRSERRLGEAELVDLITPVCDRLARAIVENGEGTEHVIELQVRGVADREQARAIGRHVLNSPLVKTAVSGNDPNVGRLLAATGDALSTWDSDTRIDAESLRVSMFGREIYADGRFLIDAECEAALSDKLRATAADATVRGFPQGKSPVSITLQFSGGGAEPEPVRLYGSDLSHEYIRENADYRT